MKVLIILSVIFLAVLIIWIAGTFLAVRNIEEPKYEVLEKNNDYEIRKYAPYIVAEATVTGTQQQGLNQGFRLIAGYIFGGNTKKQSIAMTAPVQEIQQSESIAMTVPVLDTASTGNTRIIQFVMPSKYTLETLPEPNNSEVKLREVAGNTKAVLRYTGWATEKKVAEKKKTLSRLLEGNDIKTIGEMISAQYNPPLSFPFMRRNEILVEIEN